jgi:LysM repeat protein
MCIRQLHGTTLPVEFIYTKNNCLVDAKRAIQFGSFYFRIYPVVKARRRVHKTLLIQQNNQDSGHTRTEVLFSQMTENAEKSLPSHWNALEWCLFVTIIVVPMTLHSGFFSATDATGKSMKSAETSDSHAVLDVPVLSALLNPNPQGSRGGAEIVVSEDALVSSGPVGEDVIAASRLSTGEISVYTVRAGDTLSHIAGMYGVTANTILWANDLSRATAIKEGQTLIILPVAGVQHTIKKGDTLSAIAKKYDGDVEEIMEYNQVASNDDLVVGEKIVVPGGMITIPPTAASPTKIAGKSSSGGWLTHPIPGAIKTQGIHGYNAVDFGVSAGTSVRAAGTGEVMVSKSSGWNGGYGQYIVVRHSNGAQTLYAHLSRNDVGVGATVSQGQVIGASGNTGRSTGPHLHFEVRGASNPF